MTQLCRHFGTCGGCTFQDVPDAEYRARKRDAVIRALTNVGVEAQVTDVVAVAPGTRRRATLKIGKTREGIEVGFHPQRSHAIVDMRECLVLTPGLVEFVQNLRVAAAGLFATAPLKFMSPGRQRRGRRFRAEGSSTPPDGGAGESRTDAEGVADHGTALAYERVAGGVFQQGGEVAGRLVPATDP